MIIGFTKKVTITMNNILVNELIDLVIELIKHYKKK